jgi:hypothetical protein
MGVVAVNENVVGKRAGKQKRCKNGASRDDDSPLGAGYQHPGSQPSVS